MLRWREWRESLRRAREWDSAPDPEIRRLQSLFAAARPGEDPQADARLWRRLRARIHGLERERVPALSGALASFGFRFAGAAALALVLAAGLTWRDGPFGSPQGAQTASFLETPDEVLSGPLQARSGDDLLQFIAYNPAGR